MSELDATIHQSMANKIVDSVKYPFTVFEHKNPYEGFEILDSEDFDSIKINTDDFLAEISKTVQNDYSVLSIDQVSQKIEDNFFENIKDLKTNFIECKNANSAFTEYLNTNPGSAYKWDGPSIEELDDLIKTLEDYEADLSNFNGLVSLIKIKAQVTWIRVKLGNRPDFRINGQRFDLKNLLILPSGTGEVWAKYKWLKCTRSVNTPIGRICYRWRWTTRNTRLLKVTLKDIKLSVTAHARVVPKGAKVNVYAHLDELRLEYRFLRKIPLEKLGNKYLTKDPVVIFDAGIYVKTIPVLNKDFKVKAIEIPNEQDKITVKVSVEQV